MVTVVSGKFCFVLRTGRRQFFELLFGNYEWNVMSMGLTNAPATYQRLYLDDVFVHSVTLNDHVRHLQAVFEVLKAQQNSMQTFQVHLSKSISHLPWSCDRLRYICVDSEKKIEDCQHASAQDQGQCIEVFGYVLVSHIFTTQS